MRWAADVLESERRRPALPARSLAEGAYRAIEEMIVTRQLRPGSMVSENQLSEQLGCGRTPIREALQRLKFEGYVEIHPRRGVLVAPDRRRSSSSSCSRSAARWRVLVVPSCGRARAGAGARRDARRSPTISAAPPPPRRSGPLPAGDPRDPRDRSHAPRTTRARQHHRRDPRPVAPVLVSPRPRPPAPSPRAPRSMPPRCAAIVAGDADAAAASAIACSTIWSG